MTHELPPQGQSAVEAMQHLNAAVASQHINHFTRSTLAGNAPLMVNEKTPGLSVPMRVHSALHGVMLHLAGAVGQMLDVDRLGRDHPDLGEKLAVLAADNALYEASIKAGAQLHADVLGHPDAGTLSPLYTRRDFTPTPYYRDDEAMFTQLGDYYAAHPREDQTRLAAIRKTAPEQLGDAVGWNGLVGTFRHADMRGGDMPTPLGYVLNALDNLKSYPLRGFDEPVKNRRAAGKWRYSMATNFFCLQNAARGFMKSGVPPLTRESYAQVIGGGEGIIQQLTQNVLRDKQLHQPAMFGHFERAHGKAQSAVALWISAEEAAHHGRKAVINDQTSTVLDLLQLRDPDMYAAAHARGVASRPARSRETVAPMEFHPNLDDMTATQRAFAKASCPYLGMADNRPQ